METHFLKYVEVARQGRGGYRERPFDTAEAWMEATLPNGGQRDLYLYDRLSRMLLYLRVDTTWEGDRKAAVASEALGIQAVFGDKLYRDFVERVEQTFQRVQPSDYGPFYISPTLYRNRSGIVFSFDDPYFRVDGEGKAVHVWRKEWEGLLGASCQQ